MGAIVPFLKSDAAVFGPQDVQAMSIALDDICKGRRGCGQRNRRRPHHRAGAAW